MNKKKQIFGWAMYDWANSAFATTVMAGFFPIFFKVFWNAGVDDTVFSFRLSIANSVASLIVAASAPILGAIADRGSQKKRFLIFFAYVGVLMTSTLFLLGEGQWVLASIIYGIGIIGFSGANVLYDSLLPSVASEEKIDYISGLGFALGYLGGGILFAINVMMYNWPDLFGLENWHEAIKFTFLTVGLWWGLFTIPLIIWVKEEKANVVSSENLIIGGFQQLRHTFKKIRQLRMTFLFLIAYWFYIDGVDTIVRMAVDFGLSIGFEITDLIKALLITQFVGFPSAIAFGKLGQKWNVKKSIFIGIIVYFFVTIFAMFMTNSYEFYILAGVIGLVQGGVQALSRSFYSRLIPPNQVAEFYGFYNMLGKFAAIIGPLLYGGVGMVARSFGYSDIASRAGIGSIVILFILGGILLYKVDEKQGKIDVQNLE